jgi:hypothetical protein
MIGISLIYYYIDFLIIQYFSLQNVNYILEELLYLYL